MTLTTEVESFTCQFCHERIPPRTSKSRHEQYCTKNPAGSAVPLVDLRRRPHQPHTGLNPASCVITFNITYDAYRALNALLDAGVYTSRSEALRAAVNLLMFVHDKKITVNDK
jgi:hypothetical protein